jgi:hypothetical protein
MPVLHNYKDRNDYYVLTSINGKIITFQLTQAGNERLKLAGIQPGEAFGRAILLDLYRSGDAFTHGTGPGEEISKTDPRQLELDFKNDPDPESLFPGCASCSSPVSLHLVEIKEKVHLASILCADCRSEKSKSIDTSIPIQIVNRSVLKHILEIKRIEKTDPSVIAYRELLETQFQTKWDEIAKAKTKKKSVKQETLFDKPDDKQGKLI